MGLTDEDTQALRQVPGVLAAQPQIITEGSILDNGTAHASAILSLDLEQTRSEQPGDVDRGQINRPTVVEGRLPEAPDELLFSRGETPRDNTTRLGDVVTIGSLYGTDHPSELLRYDEFTVVGFVQSSYYLSEAVGQSPLSGSVLSRYAYLPLQALTTGRVHRRADRGRRVRSDRLPTATRRLSMIADSIRTSRKAR